MNETVGEGRIVNYNLREKKKCAQLSPTLGQFNMFQEYEFIRRRNEG